MNTRRELERLDVYIWLRCCECGTWRMITQNGPSLGCEVAAAANNNMWTNSACSDEKKSRNCLTLSRRSLVLVVA
jgi:hypothetical protein